MPYKIDKDVKHTTIIGELFATMGQMEPGDSFEVSGRLSCDLATSVVSTWHSRKDGRVFLTKDRYEKQGFFKQRLVRYTRVWRIA